MSDSFDYDELSNNELVNRIKDSEVMVRFEKSDDWRLVREACERIHKQAQRAIAKVDPKDSVSVGKYQVVLEIYGNFIQSIINMNKQDGLLCLDEVKHRGLTDILPKFFK